MKDLTPLLTAGTLAAAATLCGMSSTALAETPQLSIDGVRLQLNYSIPRSSDNWDGGVGVMAQTLLPGDYFKLPMNYKVALGIGFQQWDVNDDVETIDSGNAANGTGNLDGDITAFQLGASVMRLKGLDNGVELSTEVGLMYSVISSDATINVTYSGGANSASDELSIDNTLQAIVGIDASMKANDDLTVFGGLAYQLDFGIGDAEAFGDSEKNVTSALLLRGGIHF